MGYRQAGSKVLSRRWAVQLPYSSPGRTPQDEVESGELEGTLCAKICNAYCTDAPRTLVDMSNCDTPETCGWSLGDEH